MTEREWIESLGAECNCRGVVLTPRPLVARVLAEVADLRPATVLDIGCGSGRFMEQAAEHWQVPILGIDIDPSACHLASRFGRVRMMSVFDLEPPPDPTLFIGNLPYIRNQHLETSQREAFAAQLEAAGQHAPLARLAGLYVYILWHLSLILRDGDAYALIIPQEWLRAGYGRVVRSLLRGSLGLRKLIILDAAEDWFDGVLGTGCIIVGRAGYVGDVAVKHVSKRGTLSSTSFSRTQLKPEQPWPPRIGCGSGQPLGDVFRVRAGRPTGNKRLWLDPNLPERFTQPIIDSARRLAAAEAGGIDPATLPRMVSLPLQVAADDEGLVREWLRSALAAGVQDTATARARRQWWRPFLVDPAPIVVSYTWRGRRPHVAYNPQRVRHLNTVLGLYPRTPMTEAELHEWVVRLRALLLDLPARQLAGGLWKIEPRELEAAILPG